MNLQMNLETFDTMCFSVSPAWMDFPIYRWLEKVCRFRKKSGQAAILFLDKETPLSLGISIDHTFLWQGIESSAGVHERQVPFEPDVINTPVNRTFPVHSHRLLSEALIVFYKANAPSDRTNLHF